MADKKNSSKPTKIEKPLETKPKVERKSAPAVGGRIPDVDRAGFDAKIDSLETELKSLKVKQEALATKIGDKTGGKEEYQRQRDQAKAALDANAAVIAKLEEQRNKLNEQLQAKLKEGESMKAEINSKKKAIGFQSVEEVDREIANIEYKMHTESLGIKAERDLILQISKLKQVKPEILKLKNLKAGAGMDDSVGGIKAEQVEIQKKLSEARDEKRKLSAALGKIMDARKKAMEGVSDLVEGRDSIYQAIKKAQTELKRLRDEKFAAIRDFRAAMEEAKVARAEREKIEKAYKEAEGARRKLEDELVNENVLPFLDQIELAENSIKYCQKLVPAIEVKEEKKKVEIAALPNTSGTLLAKSQREEVFFFAPTVKAAKKVSTKKDEVKHFTHSLDTIALFAALKLTAPSAPKDVEDVVKALETKIHDLKKKQVDVIAERKAKRAEKESALAEATKVADAAKAEWVKVAPPKQE